MTQVCKKYKPKQTKRHTNNHNKQRSHFANKIGKRQCYIIPFRQQSLQDIGAVDHIGVEFLFDCNKSTTIWQKMYNQISIKQKRLVNWAVRVRGVILFMKYIIPFMKTHYTRKSAAKSEMRNIAVGFQGKLKVQKLRGGLNPIVLIFFFFFLRKFNFEQYFVLKYLRSFLTEIFFIIELFF